MSINYVIATYGQNSKRIHSFPPKEKTLQVHIQKLTEFKNNLKQITIMKAHCENTNDEYYNISNLLLNNTKIKESNCENYGYSMGQWLKAYELDIKKNNIHDYYFFVEDDYCPNCDNFDKLLIDCYKKNFANKIGILCSHIIEQQSSPSHFEGIFITSKESLSYFYKFPYWEGNPRVFLDKITSKIDPKYNWNQFRQNYIGGYYQIAFSNMFRLSGINHKSINDSFLYWFDSGMYQSGGQICKLIHKNGKSYTITSYTQKDLDKAIIVPIQISDIDTIKKNTYIHNNILQIFNELQLKQSVILLVNFPIVISEKILNKYKSELEMKVFYIHLLDYEKIHKFEYDTIKTYKNVCILEKINDRYSNRNIEYDYIIVNHNNDINVPYIKQAFKSKNILLITNLS
jgi:hypothetical protein